MLYIHYSIFFHLCITKKQLPKELFFTLLAKCKLEVFRCSAKHSLYSFDDHNSEKSDDDTNDGIYHRVLSSFDLTFISCSCQIDDTSDNKTDHAQNSNNNQQPIHPVGDDSDKASRRKTCSSGRFKLSAHNHWNSCCDC